MIASYVYLIIRKIYDPEHEDVLMLKEVMGAFQDLDYARSYMNDMTRVLLEYPITYTGVVENVEKFEDSIIMVINTPEGSKFKEKRYIERHRLIKSKN